MTKAQKESLIKIAAGAALLIAAWLIPAKGILRLVLFLIPYAVVGYETVFHAVKNIAHGKVFDENFLMTIATVGAFAIGEYPEAVAVMLFNEIGEFFESLAEEKSRRSISDLMDIRPDSANVLREEKEITVSPEEVAVGEIIVVRPGEKIPLDGVVAEGTASLNTAALTGEALPRSVTAGENVVSGSIDLDAVIRIRTTGTFRESTVSKILDLVENASAKKARSEAFITRFSKYYTPCVVLGALLLAVLPSLLFHADFHEWLRRALVFLVVSCPCALVISVPLTFFSGIGGASKKGILMKGANDLEALSKAKTVVFDKTGTLTSGTFTVTAIHPNDMPESELLDIAALAESFSSHPIAESIVRAHAGHIDKSRITSISEKSGFGVEAVIDGQKTLAGNEKLLAGAGIEWKACHHAGTIVHIAVDGVYCGHIVISDQVKPDSAAAVAALKALGILKAVMLTGDKKDVGEAVGRELKLDEVHAELLPADKVGIVEKLLAEKPPKTTLAFVGDGINDAPVLSRADVGIAMGAMGSDAAIEAADIVLMDDKPSKLPLAVSIARRTVRIVRQNISFALSVKAAVLILGALGIANLWLAVFADVGVSVLCVFNAMRARSPK